MCGIAGILNLDARPVSAAMVKRMSHALAHRGPDGEGVFLDGSIGLGHKRLAVIDLSSDAQQPMCNEDRSVWLTFNGEIYNFRELRRELEGRGHRFRSHTDSEVILHAYEEYDLEFLSHLSGMFAFALWDKRQQRLLLARDRLGIKPLFFAHTKNSLIFGSEIKSLLEHPDVPRTLNRNALHDYLSLNYVVAPRTLFSGIMQLEPAHYLLSYADGRSREQRYWDVGFGVDASLTESQVLDCVRSHLERSVSSQLVSDVPVGVFLSGGVDSSAIAALMTHSNKSPIQTFSVGFNEPTYSELNFARQMAQHIKSHHHEMIVAAEVVETLPKLVWHAEEPTADSSMLPLYHLARLARSEVKVVLSGEGGDEVFAGYETYRAPTVMGFYSRLPLWMRTHVLPRAVDLLPVSSSKVSFESKLRRFVRGAHLTSQAAHLTWRMIFSESEKSELYSPEFGFPPNGHSTSDTFQPFLERVHDANLINQLLYVDLCGYLPNDMLVKADRMTMAHSLEARLPLLDHDLVEFMAQVPPKFKLRNGWGLKPLLRGAVKDLVPTPILRRGKQGFNVPKGLWMQGIMRDFVAARLLEPSAWGRLGLFRPEGVKRIVQDHWDGHSDNSHQIWSLMCLDLWLDRFEVSL